MLAARLVLRGSSSSRLIAPVSTAVTGRRTIVTSEKSETMDLMRLHLDHLRMNHSIEPRTYSGNLALAPAVDTPKKFNPKKVTVVGCGQVGLAIAFAMLNQTTPGTIALVDMNADKLEGEARDLQQGSGFHQSVRIEASTDYSVSANSHLVIITAGVAQKVGESRLSLIERNVEIMKFVVPNVLAHSPHAAICIVSNPCDIMTAVAAKIAGPRLPPGRIFGSGTCLDSSRLQSLLAKALDIDARSVNGYVIGEHGDSSVPVWSSVRIGGVPMLNYGESPTDIHNAMHREVVDSAGDVIRKKGYTNWAVGLTGAYIARAVLEDTRSIMPLSTCVRGFHGIEHDVFLSMPCSIGAGGVKRVIDLPLTDLEVEGFQKSAETVWDVQKDFWHNL